MVLQAAQFCKRPHSRWRPFQGIPAHAAHDGGGREAGPASRRFLCGRGPAILALAAGGGYFHLGFHRAYSLDRWILFARYRPDYDHRCGPFRYYWEHSADRRRDGWYLALHG